MIVFTRNNKGKRLKARQIGYALNTLMTTGHSVHSKHGHFLIPLLNILEKREIAYKLTAFPNIGYQIDLIRKHENPT